MERNRRTILLVLAGVIFLGTLVFAAAASAHECTTTTSGKGKKQQTKTECHETPVMPNWRGTYIPLFDLADREDEAQRYDAQRWRDECNNGDPNSPNYQSRQMCQWAYGGQSGFPNRDGDLRAPNEWHAGFAANHCFLGEFAHQCEDHDASFGEGVHDAHGGAIYVDVCLTENPESKYCNDGPQDTQAGVTVMDHNPCGTIVPIVACTDEYKLVRPLDQGYTSTQMDNSARQTQEIAADPYTWLCGYPEFGECVIPAQ